jgi:hypothetical protein
MTIQIVQSFTAWGGNKKTMFHKGSIKSNVKHCNVELQGVISLSYNIVIEYLMNQNGRTHLFTHRLIFTTKKLPILVKVNKVFSIN